MNKLYSLLAVTTIAVAAPANATIAIVFDDFDDGIANFNSTVTGAGATASALSLVEGTSGSPADFGDFTIGRPNGSSVVVDAPYTLFSSFPSRDTSGGVIDISPSGASRGIGAKDSGVTFNFTNPINALGFEVGDWATCCQPSDLYIQFGNNTPILVGASVDFGDQFLTNDGAGVFVAAFDDTDSFTQVSFWGDGFGEFLVIGGTVRYALLDQGTLPPIPEPATWAMMLAGFTFVGAAMRTRRRKMAIRFA